MQPDRNRRPVPERQDHRAVTRLDVSVRPLASPDLHCHRRLFPNRAAPPELPLQRPQRSLARSRRRHSRGVPFGPPEGRQRRMGRSFRRAHTRPGGSHQTCRRNPARRHRIRPFTIRPCPAFNQISHSGRRVSLPLWARCRPVRAIDPEDGIHLFRILHKRRTKQIT